jgi:hypothetical protein
MGWFFCSPNFYGFEVFGPPEFDPVEVCICVYFLFFFFFPLVGRQHETVTENVFSVVYLAISGRSLIRHFYLMKPDLFQSTDSLLTHSPWWCLPSSTVVVYCGEVAELVRVLHEQSPVAKQSLFLAGSLF